MTTTATPAADTGLPDDPRNRETEILRLFHEHRSLVEAGAIYIAANLRDRDLDAKMDRLFNVHTDALEDAIMALPSTCAADVAAKMILAHREGDATCLSWDDDPVWIEARALVGLKVADRLEAAAA